MRDHPPFESLSVARFRLTAGLDCLSRGGDALRRLARTRGIHDRTRAETARALRLVAIGALLAAPGLGGTAQAVVPSYAAEEFPFGIGRFGSQASPVLADLDGDGDLDALIGISSGDLLFFRNTGSARVPAFAPPSTNPFGLSAAGNYYASPALADIDGDGDLDAFTGEVSGITVFFRNTGSAAVPAFAAPSTNPFGLQAAGFKTSPTFADGDGDGDLDAWVGAGTGNTVFFRNTGSTTAPAFAAPSTNPFGLQAGIGLNAPAFADTDGDGDLDAWIGDGSGRTLFFRNVGSSSAPAFAAPSTNPFGLADVGDDASPVLADSDGDGDFDVWIGTKAGNTVFFQNTGSANAPAFLAPSSTRVFIVSDVGLASAPVFADLDGNGILDAWVGKDSGQTLFFQNLGSAALPIFITPSTNPFGLSSVAGYASPAFGDIDGDGDLDAFIGALSGETAFFRNTGSSSAPSFAPPATGPFGLLDVGDDAAPALADIDGDRDLDAWIGERNGRVIFFRNTGSSVSPAFAAPSTNPFGLADAGDDATPAFSDFDRDGDLDVAVGNTDGNTLFFRNTGSAVAPAFAAPSTNPFGIVDVGDFAKPAFADVNGDGNVDLWMGQGSGETAQFVNLPVRCRGLFVTQPAGGPGADSIQGTAGDDVLAGGAGDDVVDGLGGNDVLCGDAGADTLLGGPGSDLLEGADGADALFGDAGNDQLAGGVGDDTLAGGDGDDTIDAGDGADVIYGDAGLDVVFGGSGDDVVLGGDGNDVLFGESGMDRLLGLGGDDVLFGGSDDDNLSGGAGNDRISGQDGNDRVAGKGGDDRLRGGSGNDTVLGGGGDDLLNGGSGTDNCSDALGTNTFVACP